MTVTRDEKDSAFLDFSLFLYSIPSIEIKVANEILEKLSNVFSGSYVPYIQNEINQDLISKNTPSETRG